MKKVICILGSILCAWVCSAAVPGTLRLKPQEIKVVNFDRAVKSADPSSTCVEVVGLSERRVKITAKTPGTACVDYVLVNGEQGTINILVQGAQTVGALGGLREYLLSALDDVIGIDEVRVNSSLDVVEVTGEIGVFADWNEYRRVLSQIEDRWPGKVMNLVKFKPALPQLEKSLVEILKGIDGITDASVVAVKELGIVKVVLGGSAYSEADIAIAENVITTFLQRRGVGEVALINNISKSDAVIEIEFTYFRLADTIDKELGLDLLNEIKLSAALDASYGTGQQPTYTGNIEFNLSEVFSMLEANGLANVINKQTVRAENGLEGTANFGGELIIRPYANDSGSRSEPERVPYGFIVKVIPNLKGSDRVRLDLEIENSTAEYDAQSNDYRKQGAQAKTVLDMPLNGMQVLAVNQNRSRSDTNTGTPILRNIPGLKLIFGKQAKKVLMSYEGFVAIPRLSGAPNIVNTPSVAARTDEILAKIEKKLSE